MTGRIKGLADDRRARIPFAVIALLLLVSSGMFAVQLEHRDDPKPAFEADRALERTEAATRTALSQALTDASERAAAQPLTTTADTPYGRVLSNGTADPFDRYLETLVYLQATERLGTVGQQVGDVETSVSLPEITDRLRGHRQMTSVWSQSAPEPTRRTSSQRSSRLRSKE